MKISKTSVALLLIQLAIVSTVAAKYLYQRWTCPRVWTRTVAFDPELPMRGRYLSLRLWWTAARARCPRPRLRSFARDINGAAVQGPFQVQALVRFRAELKVENNHLVVIALRDDQNGTLGQGVVVSPGAACDAMRLDTPVDFFVSEHAADPSRLQPGQELWIEVTVPPKGPPRPIQLALKDNSAWKPLANQ